MCPSVLGKAIEYALREAPQFRHVAENTIEHGVALLTFEPELSRTAHASVTST